MLTIFKYTVNSVKYIYIIVQWISRTFSRKELKLYAH